MWTRSLALVLSVKAWAERRWPVAICLALVLDATGTVLGAAAFFWGEHGSPLDRLLARGDNNLLFFELKLALAIACLLLGLALGIFGTITSPGYREFRDALTLGQVVALQLQMRNEPRLRALLQEDDPGQRELLIAILGWRSAEKVGRALIRVTWVLAIATVGLVVATVALIRRGG